MRQAGRGTKAIPLEAQFSEIASYIALVIEAGALLLVAFGAIQALVGFARSILQRAADEMEGRQLWIRFATWILLALEFAFAADLVRTAVAVAVAVNRSGDRGGSAPIAHPPFSRLAQT